MVAGVAAGLAEYMNLDPTIVRLLFVLLALAGGPGILIYIIMWIVMPEA
jgi:phage shock protein C